MKREPEIGRVRFSCASQLAVRTNDVSSMNLSGIGPTRTAYDRMIQIVDITSRLVSNALSSK